MFKQFKSLAIILLIFLLMLLLACNKTKEISQKIDSTANKIGKEIDTAASKITQSADTLFDKVKLQTADTTGKAPQTVRKRINGVYNDYIDVKNTLAENDSSKAVNEANQLVASLDAVSDTALTTKMQAEWKSLSSKLTKAAENVAAAKNLQKQREAFSQLTDAMLQIVKTFGLDGKTVYHITCTGGKNWSWLTDKKDSSNPYTGDAKPASAGKTLPPKCGEIKEAWQF